MINSEGPSASSDTLREEASVWLRRLTGGSATRLDLVALDRWRARSPDHRQAFAEAALLWQVVGEAAATVLADRPDLAVPRAGPAMGRRRLLFGGFALAASAAGLGVVRPPLGLWPSLFELGADYRTGHGERRRIDVAGRISLELNTSTSVDLPPVSGGRTMIELIAGEAVVLAGHAASEAVVRAGTGRAAVGRGSLNIRKTGNQVCVTCLEGDVRVRTQQGGAVLNRGQQVVYDDRGLAPVVATDADAVAAWRDGLLIFRQRPLAQVIDEVNRYRSGKIVLLDSELGRRPVVATFRLDRIDDAVIFVSKVMKVPARFLPGGVVLLG